MAVSNQPGVPRLSFARFKREAARWIAESWIWALGAAVVSFVIGWAWNTYLMATDLDGSLPLPGSETTATAEGKGGNFVYWMLAFSILFGVAAYIRGRGLRNAIADAKRLPSRLLKALAGNPVACVALAAWGAGIALLISVVLSKAMAGLLSLGFLVALPTAIVTILNGTLIRLWGSLAVRLAPVSSWRLDPLGAPAAMAIGQVLAFLIAWQIESPVIKFFLAIVAIGGSLVLALTAQKPTPAQVASLFVIVAGAAVLYDLMNGSGVAFADDGGWNECVTDDFEPCRGIRGVLVWFRSPGADRLMERGVIGALGAMLGGVLGTTLGGSIGRAVRVGRLRPVTLRGAEAQQFLSDRGLLVPQAETGQLVLRDDAAKIGRSLAGSPLQQVAAPPPDLADTVTLSATGEPVVPPPDPSAPPPPAPSEPQSLISNAEIRGATGRFVDLDSLEVDLEIEDPVLEAAIEPEPIADPVPDGAVDPVTGQPVAGTEAGAGTAPAEGTPTSPPTSSTTPPPPSGSDVSAGQAPPAQATPAPPPPPPGSDVAGATQTPTPAPPPPPPPAADIAGAVQTPTPAPPPPPPGPDVAGATQTPTPTPAPPPPPTPEPAGAGAGATGAAGDPTQTMSDFGEGRGMDDFGEGRSMGDFGEGRSMEDFGEGRSMDDVGEGRRMEDFGEGREMDDVGGAEGGPPDEPRGPGEGTADRARRRPRNAPPDGGGDGSGGADSPDVP